jgi:hypothetical protein
MILVADPHPVSTVNTVFLSHPISVQPPPPHPQQMAACPWPHVSPPTPQTPDYDSRGWSLSLWLHVDQNDHIVTNTTPMHATLPHSTSSAMSHEPSHVRHATTARSGEKPPLLILVANGDLDHYELALTFTTSSTNSAVGVLMLVCRSSEYAMRSISIYIYIYIHCNRSIAIVDRSRSIHIHFD